MVPESRLRWIPISTRLPLNVPFQISMTEMQLQEDLRIELDELTILSDPSLFKLSPKQVFPYEKDDETLLEVSIEMNLSQTIVFRKVRNTFDYLSDVGGL